MTKKPKKMRFRVEEGETISDCLARMDREGYKPKRRMEKPIFKEKEDGVEPVAREIIFEGVLKE
ncbi:NETI motif-containing protein [Salirhabdus sp. Marseille-P4669]|uniref:NETI motif-containing protein n=1 Tax=Salirhabdus sp. Marseille-P4669 TaxID=2042310 RepID=UPI000C7C92E2|nr:NETI motif-containing protein [Salirhabdus sp. Marseille-P4669]